MKKLHISHSATFMKGHVLKHQRPFPFNKAFEDEIVSLCFRRGQYVDAQDTPLCTPPQNGRLSFSKQLLENGAHVKSSKAENSRQTLQASITVSLTKHISEFFLQFRI